MGLHEMKCRLDSSGDNLLVT